MVLGAAGWSDGDWRVWPMDRGWDRVGTPEIEWRPPPVHIFPHAHRHTGKFLERKGMKIPKRFKLLGHTIEVSEEPGRYYEHKAFASCDFEGKWIKIVPPSEHHPITQGSLEHSFLHEVVHLILNHTEQSGLGQNEDFVDLFAGLLHQALTTMEYE